ncbi:MAG TPA: hypothetical protein PLL06_09980 [Acidobacteriota bacterium]|nr:hypothetical protein [Acidobacteriota bacterium]HNJ40274.1 hypothetical protein [Acidobacteriota bacterium]
MPSANLIQLEELIGRLPIIEQLVLIERVSQQIRQRLSSGKNEDAQLAFMAADPEIQTELGKINDEFLVTEADGLEVQ